MQTKQVLMYNVLRRSESEVVRYVYKNGYQDILKIKPMCLFFFFSQIISKNKRVQRIFESILYLVAKMFKLEKCILSYACFNILER